MILTTLNKHAGPDGWLAPTLCRLYRDADYVCLVLNYQSGFEFDTEQARSCAGKPVVVLDYSEASWNTSWDTGYIAGHSVNNGENRPTLELEQYLRLDEWLSRQRIVAYGKREFSARIQRMEAEGKFPFPIFPLEIFFNNLPSPPTPDKGEFLARLGAIYHVYGNSHPDRKRLAGAIQEQHERVVNSIGRIQALVNHRLPFSVVEQVEAIDRYSVQDVIHHQGFCQLSVNFPGAGVKAFRLAEAYHNAIPVMMDLGMKYAIQPTNENAVMLPCENGRLKVQESMEIITQAFRDHEGLWSRMREAHGVALQFSFDHYPEVYINRHIRKSLE